MSNPFEPIPDDVMILAKSVARDFTCNFKVPEDQERNVESYLSRHIAHALLTNGKPQAERIAELEAALSIKNASYQIDPDEAICNAVRIGQSAHWVSADGTVKSIDPADFYDQPKEPTS